MFVLRETLRFIRHSWASWLMGILTLGITLGVSGLFGYLAWKAHLGINSVRNNMAIEAFFDPGISTDDAQNIVNLNIKNLAGISRIEFISKEQALKDYAASSGENVEHVLGMNPLPASVKVYLSNPDVGSAASIESGLRTIEGIQEVRTNTPLLQEMTSRSQALDRIAITIGALMILSALFFALIAGRHSFEIRKNATHTFTLLGASRWSGRGPVIIAASVGGIIGGIIAVALLLLVHSQLLPINTGFSLSIESKKIVFGSLSLAIAGLLIAAIGTSVSSLSKIRSF